LLGQRVINREYFPRSEAIEAIKGLSSNSLIMCRNPALEMQTLRHLGSEPSENYHFWDGCTGLLDIQMAMPRVCNVNRFYQGGKHNPLWDCYEIERTLVESGIVHTVSSRYDVSTETARQVFKMAVMLSVTRYWALAEFQGKYVNIVGKSRGVMVSAYLGKLYYVDPKYLTLVNEREVYLVKDAPLEDLSLSPISWRAVSEISRSWGNLFTPQWLADILDIGREKFVERSKVSSIVGVHHINNRFVTLMFEYGQPTRLGYEVTPYGIEKCLGLTLLDRSNGAKVVIRKVVFFHVLPQEEVLYFVRDLATTGVEVDLTGRGVWRSNEYRADH